MRAIKPPPRLKPRLPAKYLSNLRPCLAKPTVMVWGSIHPLSVARVCFVKLQVEIASYRQDQANILRDGSDGVLHGSVCTSFPGAKGREV